MSGHYLMNRFFKKKTPLFMRQKPKIFDVYLLTTVQTPQFRQMTRNSKAKWMMFTILFNNIKKKKVWLPVCAISC